MGVRGVEISNGVYALDLAIYIPKHRTIVCSDFHIGFEEALASQGVLVPRFQFADITKRLKNIFSQTGKVKTIVVNGDLKHEFGRISKLEWRNTLKLIDCLLEHCDEVVVVKGNHDVFLGPITARRNVKMIKDYRLNGFLFTHGDYEPELQKTDKIILIGHEHPAITLRAVGRQEKYRCFLTGRYKRRGLIVQPSFNLLTEGSDVTKEKLLSPLLKKGVRNFEVFIVDDEKREVLEFGKVADL